MAMKRKPIANNGKTIRKSNGWKPGQSGNPKGRPPEGESWGAVIKRISNMTGAEAATYIKSVAGQLRPLAGVTLKEAVVMRCLAALMFEPQASMLNTLMDRAEGKLAQTFKHDMSEELLRMMRELGLTNADIESDPLAADFFNAIGVAVSVGSEATPNDSDSQEG